jgi:hypothetical protein
MSDVSTLKPCLVLGTGFHHWVLGDTKRCEPLVSWEALLRETASNMKIPWPDTTGNRLSMQWENLMLLAAQNGYTRSVDTSPVRDHIRLNNSFNLATATQKAVRVWFPNGCITHHESLRLGLRDFGMQVSAIKNAFDQVKKFENIYRTSSNNNWANNFKVLRPLMDDESTLHPPIKLSPLPLTWVTEMLYRPVLFAGVGLCQEELGLWWLICQRARNLARIPESQRSKAAILVRRDNPDLLFWQSKPFGIEPLVCSNWDEGWLKCESWWKTYD